MCEIRTRQRLPLREPTLVRGRSEGGLGGLSSIRVVRRAARISPGVAWGVEAQSASGRETPAPQPSAPSRAARALSSAQISFLVNSASLLGAAGARRGLCEGRAVIATYSPWGFGDGIRGPCLDRPVCDLFGENWPTQLSRRPSHARPGAPGGPHAPGRGSGSDQCAFPECSVRPSTQERVTSYKL
eukprot:352609-Chlamydomonas_euryale.AAC.3